MIYEALTEALGIDHVRVIVPDIGGGFGQKIHLIRKYAVLTALMAMKTGRPVKWIEDRSEHMMAGGHSCDQEFDVEAAVKTDGEVLGLRIRDTDDVGGSVSTLTIHFTNKLNNLFNTYKVQHLRLEGRSVLTNKCPVVPNRGIGKPGMCFIWERMMDRIAQELALDPIAVRRRNLIEPHQFPVHDAERQHPRQRRLPGAPRQGAEERRLRRGQTAPAGGRAKRAACSGIGVVVGVEPGGRNAARDMAIFPQSKMMPGAGGVEGATVKVEKNGAVVFTLGSPSCGQSHETTASQIIADVLGVPPARISLAEHVRLDAVAMGRLVVQQRQQLSSLRRGRRARRGDAPPDEGAHARRARAAGGPGLARHRGGRGVQRARRTAAAITFAELGKIAYANQALLPEGFEPGLEATYYHSHPHANPNMMPDAQGRVGRSTRSHPRRMRLSWRSIARPDACACCATSSSATTAR